MVSPGVHVSKLPRLKLLQCLVVVHVVGIKSDKGGMVVDQREKLPCWVSHGADLGGRLDYQIATLPICTDPGPRPRHTHTDTDTHVYSQPLLQHDKEHDMTREEGPRNRTTPPAKLLIVLVMLWFFFFFYSLPGS